VRNTLWSCSPYGIILYSLCFSPITVIQIPFSASTVFVLSAIQACSGVRIAQKELRSSLNQQATVLNYLQIIGRSWPGAVKIATILKDLIHDRLKPLLARRKIPIQNGEILQVAELAGEDEDDPAANTESVSISRRAGIPIPAQCKERAEVPREQVPKRGKAGQSTSERSREPGMRGTEGLASARRLRPHGMPMPYFGWTRLGQGPAGTREKQD